MRVSLLFFLRANSRGEAEEMPGTLSAFEINASIRVFVVSEDFKGCLKG